MEKHWRKKNMYVKLAANAVYILITENSGNNFRNAPNIFNFILVNC